MRMHYFGMHYFGMAPKMHYFGLSSGLSSLSLIAIVAFLALLVTVVAGAGLYLHSRRVSAQRAVAQLAESAVPDSNRVPVA